MKIKIGTNRYWLEKVRVISVNILLVTFIFLNIPDIFLKSSAEALAPVSILGPLYDNVGQEYAAQIDVELAFIITMVNRMDIPWHDMNGMLDEWISKVHYGADQKRLNSRLFKIYTVSKDSDRGKTRVAVQIINGPQKGKIFEIETDIEDPKDLEYLTGSLDFRYLRSRADLREKLLNVVNKLREIGIIRNDIEEEERLKKYGSMFYLKNNHEEFEFLIEYLKDPPLASLKNMIRYHLIEAIDIRLIIDVLEYYKHEGLNGLLDFLWDGGGILSGFLKRWSSAHLENLLSENDKEIDKTAGRLTKKAIRYIKNTRVEFVYGQSRLEEEDILTKHGIAISIILRNVLKWKSSATSFSKIFFRIIAFTRVQQAIGSMGSNFFYNDFYTSEIGQYRMEAAIAHEIGHNYLRELMLEHNGADMLEKDQAMLHEFIADLFSLAFLQEVYGPEKAKEYSSCGLFNPEYSDREEFDEHLYPRERLSMFFKFIYGHDIPIDWNTLLDKAMRLMTDHFKAGGNFEDIDFDEFAERLMDDALGDKSFEFNERKTNRKISELHSHVRPLSSRIDKIFHEEKTAIIAGVERGIPVDMHIDISLLAEGNIMEVMETWSYLILRMRNIENVNYVFEMPDPDGKGSVPNSLEFDVMRAFPEQEVINTLKDVFISKAGMIDPEFDAGRFFQTRINAGKRDNSIQISIVNAEWLKWMRSNGVELGEKVYPVAMKGTSGDGLGIPLRDYETAFNIGLIQAAMASAKEKDDTRADGKRTELMGLIKHNGLVKKMNSLYKLLNEDIDITCETLCFMVHKSSIVRLNRALELAIPPIRRVINDMSKYNRMINFVLQAA